MRRIKPPASGAVIFYGSRSVADKKPSPPTAIIVADTSKTDVYPNNEESSDGMYSGIVRLKSFLCRSDWYVTDTTTSAKDTSVSCPETLPAAFISNDLTSSANQPFGMGGSASAQTILRLIKDISTLFQGVPYVKVVAGVVEQIITISDVNCHSTPLSATYARTQSLGA